MLHPSIKALRCIQCFTRLDVYGREVRVMPIKAALRVGTVKYESMSEVKEKDDGGKSVEVKICQSALSEYQSGKLGSRE